MGSQRNSYEYNHCTPPLLNFGEYPNGSGDEMRARTGMLFRHGASKMKGEEMKNILRVCCDGICMHDWLRALANRSASWAALEYTSTFWVLG